MALKFIIAYLFILLGQSLTTVTPTLIKSSERFSLQVSNEVSLNINLKRDRSLKIRQSSSIFKTDEPYSLCDTALSNKENICASWGRHNLNVSVKDDNCLGIESSQPTEDGGELVACFVYDDSQWYGGAERWYQNWPVQSVEIDNKPFLTGYDSSQSVAEPFWFNSHGVSIHVDPEVPLFVDSNKRFQGELCLIARSEQPYSKRNQTLLRYEVCVADNAVEIQKAAVSRYFGKPSGRPNDAIFSDPIYSTWVRYGRDINQEKLSTLVDEILANEFPIGQIEIDDVWEPCYGASEFDTNKFPDILSFTTMVHNLGGRVTAWIYPFINEGCNPAYQDALDNNRFIADENGNTMMNWWCGNGGAVDFTKPDVANWWLQRTKDLQTKSGLDSFKFDAGETSYLPPTPQLSENQNLVPNIYVRRYVETTANFSGFMEVRVGRNTQDLPVLVRMLDKDSRFGLDNGLHSVITTLFQMNLVGYPFVLPDMIGGNAYGDKITKELFIRWLQASTFMPTLQFSVVPWDFDEETVKISRTYLDLHASHANIIRDLADKSVADGSPINTPIWWIAPDDPDALACNDEYLLGEEILVAPVIEEGAVERDIYLPAGNWTNGNGETFTGPTWLRKYPAPLDTLPYFKKTS